MRLVWATVTAVLAGTGSAQRLEIDLDDGTAGPAVAYPSLSGRCAVGDRIVINTTAVDLGLGTGGIHFVVARALAGRGVILDQPSGGHVMKLRYTPLQVDVLAVEEQASPHHDIMSEATDLTGMPVACCGLHSQVPLVAAAVKQADPALRVAYVMTDFASLPLGLSEVVHASLKAGLLDTTISSGQAFGGEHEAVNLHSALLAARHVVHADVAIVSIGPGVVGTATPFGHGGVAQGEAVNAAGCLGGVPVVALRLSFADERSRHRAVSHHSLIALSRIALTPALVPVPHLPEEQAREVDDALVTSAALEHHRRVDVGSASSGVPDLRGVHVTTMGRSLADDPAFFTAAFAAGEVCARVARGEVFMPRGT